MANSFCRYITGLSDENVSLMELGEGCHKIIYFGVKVLSFPQ